MNKIVDCVERMIQFKQRNPGAEFDLKPNMFTARIPGHDQPFRAMSLCKLMDAVERWASEEFLARMLFGAEPAEHRGTPDDHLALLTRLCHR